MPDSPESLKTAVIVEDDPDVRHLLVAVFESAGFSTVSAGNGIDGVRAVLAYQPMITTLDVSMPGIDGIEAARRIRSGQSDTYIIMVTAMGEESDVVLGLSAGADEYITKPFRPREFRARLDAYLRRPRTPQAPAPRPRENVGPSFPGARPATGMIPTVPQGGGYPPQGYPPPGQSYPPPQPHQAQSPAAYPPPQGYAVPPQQHPGYAPPAQATPPEWQVVPPSDPAAEESAARSSAAEDAYDEAIIAEIDQPGSDIARVDPHAGWLTHRDLRVDPEGRGAVIGDEELDLTRTEFELLATLMSSQRRIRSKADLTLVLRGESYVTSYFVGEADKQAIEAHMTNLRRKLGDTNPQNPRYIESVRGVGWRLTAEA
ncbi:response regulator [Microbacterium sp. HA-8]|uniref:response regulator transcription factor n=1 Tax=Microbacterium sp. HA-8 TaxID=3234200 RepID=UPI0038F74E1F